MSGRFLWSGWRLEMENKVPLRCLLEQRYRGMNEDSPCKEEMSPGLTDACGGIRSQIVFRPNAHRLAQETTRWYSTSPYASPSH